MSDADAAKIIRHWLGAILLTVSGCFVAGVYFGAFWVYGTRPGITMYVDDQRGLMMDPVEVNNVHVAHNPRACVVVKKIIYCRMPKPPMTLELRNTWPKKVPPE